MTKLLVTNLPLDFSASDLEDLFTNVGDVRSVQVDTDPSTGLSAGVGHIEMSSEEQARDCIQRFNRQNTRGHILAVREDRVHIPIPLVKRGSVISRSSALNKKRKKH